jgi:hypothetical protein
MDKFPDNFTRKTCNDQMATNQLILIKGVRKKFYEAMLEAISDCSHKLILEFPDKLWHEHKLTLIKELLERFGKFKIVCGSQYDVTRLIDNIQDVPMNIKKIIIEFIKDT